MLKGWAARGKEVGGILLIPWNTISSVLRKHFLSNMFAYKNFISFFCVFSYCSCKQETKEQYWDNNFVKRKGTFQSNWLKWPDQSKRTTFKAGPEYSSRTKPKEYVPLFWCTNQNFWNFGLNGKSPSFSVFRNFQVSCWKMEGNQLIDHSKVFAVRYSC